MSWARGVAPPEEGEDATDTPLPSTPSSSSSSSSSAFSAGQRPARIAGNFLNRHKEGRSASAYFVANEASDGINPKSKDPRRSLKILMSEEEKKEMEREEGEKEEERSSGSAVGRGGDGKGIRILRANAKSEYSFDDVAEGGKGEGRPERPNRKSKHFNQSEISTQLGHSAESQSVSSPNLGVGPRLLPKSPQGTRQQASPLSRQMVFAPDGEGRGGGGGGGRGVGVGRGVGGGGEEKKEEEEEDEDEAKGRAVFSESEREVLRQVDSEEFLLSHNLHQFKDQLAADGFTSVLSLSSLQSSHLRKYGLPIRMARTRIAKVQFSIQNILSNVTLVDADDDAASTEKEKLSKSAAKGDDERDEREREKEKDGRRGRRVTLTLCRDILPHAFGAEKCANCFQPIAKHSQEAIAAYYSGETQPEEKSRMTTSAVSPVRSVGGVTKFGMKMPPHPASQCSSDAIQRRGPAAMKLSSSSTFQSDTKMSGQLSGGYKAPPLSHSQSLMVMQAHPDAASSSRVLSPQSSGRKASPTISSPTSPRADGSDPPSPTSPEQSLQRRPSLLRTMAGTQATKSFSALEYCAVKPKRGGKDAGADAVCQCCSQDLGEMAPCVMCQTLICGRCMTKRVCHICSGRSGCPFNSSNPTTAVGSGIGEGKSEFKPGVGSDLLLSPRSYTEDSTLANLSPRVGRTRDQKGKKASKTPFSRAASTRRMPETAEKERERGLFALVPQQSGGAAKFCEVDDSADLSFDPEDGAPTTYALLANVGSMPDDKLEERFFHDRLNCLVERGGAGLRQATPYIYERVCPPSSAYSLGGKIFKVQFADRYMTKVAMPKDKATILLRDVIDEALRRRQKTYSTKLDSSSESGPFGLGVSVTQVEHLIVKVPGKEVYVRDMDVTLDSLAFIRFCVDRSLEIVLQVAVRDRAGEEEAKNVFPLLLYGDRDLGFELKDVAAYNVAGIGHPFCFRLVAVQNFSWEAYSQDERKRKKVDPSQTGFLVECSLFTCGEEIYRHRSGVTENGHWNELVNLGLPICELPLSVRLCFTVWGYSTGRKTALTRVEDVSQPLSPQDGFFPVGWVNFNLFTFDGRLRDGAHTLRLWADQVCNPLGTTTETKDGSAATLTIAIPQSKYPIVFRQEAIVFEAATAASSQTQTELLSSDFPLKKLLEADPLYVMTSEERALLWKYRNFVKANFPQFLPKVILSADWSSRDRVNEVYRLLSVWPPIPPVTALELLDAKFTDSNVRLFAVKRLSEMSDLQLEDYMLQLVQTLKHEPHHVSSLCYFLFLRAIQNPRLIGHILFWYLESELDSVDMSHRFRLLKKELLLSFNEEFRNELLRQCAVVRQLVTIAKQVKEQKEREKRDEVLRLNLQKIEEIGQFSLPMDPRIRVDGILISECKTMQSATVPLFLTFRNVDTMGEKARVIFKVGDDLRQDILTLQIIRIMDNLWKEESKDLFVIPYRVAATGSNAGMIEVVPRSKTTADIHKEYGGGALGALKEDVLWTYLKDQAEGDEAKVRRTFAYSCAAYCVITYVMGIGDRHNDNIMIQETGNLFHIDFGFILGNFLKFAGIERETTPFVLTREMVYVMGGQGSATYKEFTSSCYAAYEIIRKNGHLFLALFSMMLSTGMPNLQKVEDLAYFKEAMKFGMTSEEAEKDFERLIRTSLKNTRIYLNNVVHILANN